MKRRMIVAVACVGAVVCGMAAPAFAHVSIDPPSVPQGSTSRLSFLVPDELAPATTTDVQVFFPTGADAIPGVTVEAKPGWKFTITKQRLAKPITTDDGTINEVVSAVDWKATTPAAAIRPDEFGEFTINADGISAHATQLVFKVIQTYSNRTAVRWVDPVTAGGPAAEHPTPILELTAPGQSGGSVTTTTGAPATSGTTIISTTKDNSARALAVVAMVLGAVALLVATGALIKKRRA